MRNRERKREGERERERLILTGWTCKASIADQIKLVHRDGDEASALVSKTSSLP